MSIHITLPRAFRAGTALAAALALAPVVRAQTLAQRVAAVGDGTAEVEFAARDGVCGDGAHFMRLGFDDARYEIHDRDVRSQYGYDREQACVPGPLRVVVSVRQGTVTRLRTHAGPRPATGADRRDLGLVSVAEAVVWLGSLIDGDDEHVAEQALLPYTVADSTTPWPTLVRVARDERRSRALRGAATTWLSRGAADAAGVARAREDEDDDVRGSAVFAISQQPREIAVPRLLELARSATRPAVRSQAMFWLGQTGDPRAVSYFAELLKVR